ncbi:MAG: MarC family protein, partial [Dokdonia donghaensis]|nr:MarC family protein [Dokdonia donghaensis]
MTEVLTSIFFIFAVIDPIGTIPVYLEATKEFDVRYKKKIAIRASVMAFMILLF